MVSMYYLRCVYGPGFWKDHEYQVKFRVFYENSEDSCFVNKKDVVPVNEKFGLVKIVVKSFEEENVLIEINNSLEHKKSRFYVPKTEVIENASLINSISK